MRLIRQLVGEEERAGSGGSLAWIDLDLNDAGAKSWLQSQIRLEEETLNLVLNEVNRNRCLSSSQGLFLSLCYPSGAQEDGKEEAVLHIGVLITPSRILTVHRGCVPSIEALWSVLREDEEELTSAWNVLTQLVLRVTVQVELILDQAAGEIDLLEDRVFEDDSQPPIDELGKIRRQLILDRRHIASMTRVFEESVDDHGLGLDEKSIGELRGVVQSITRLERTVEFFLERANLIQDQIQSQLSDRLNTATLRLGIVATVFLPLSFLTGLLGINVGGMPGSHNPIAFWVVCAILTILAIGAWIVVARFHIQNLGRARECARKHPKSR